MPLSSPALLPARVLTERRADGSLVLTSPHPLGEVPRTLVDLLRRWSSVTPERTFLADRLTEGRAWRRVTYGEARRTVDRLAQGLLDRGLSPERPLLLLSENGVDHALLTLAAMTAGVPAAPVSAAYSLLSDDLAKVRSIAEILAPGLVWASDAARYGRALAALAGSGASCVVSRGAHGDLLPLDALLERDPGDELEARFAALGPETIAKVLFTSGSTGLPKGVINTQRMLCSNQAAIAAVWPFLRERPPVVLDWLPWSHTFGGNHNFNMVLFHGGSLHVDDGKPTPELVGRTLENIRDVRPSLYFNVPRGFDVILPFLERDPSLRDALFRELDVLFYAAASLPNPLWERLEALSLASRGELVLMLSAWGSTETSPMATTVHWRIRRAGVIGLPAPGTAVKLAPAPPGSKLELRVRGPGVTPGYWKRPELTAAAFDEDGFFRMGDGGKLVDPDDPAQGIAFDGRIAEDFKLGSGTWVHAGAVRVATVAAGAPYVQDVVVAGLDREEIGLLVFPSPLACKELCPGVALEDLGARPELRAFLEGAYQRHNAANPSSSHRVGRVIVLAEPPSIDANEITDKGYINQRAVLERRAALVERLYASDPAVLVLS
jgi:feruloyl-CoA synthase